MELDRFTVIGNYLRFDERTRTSLKDFRQRVFDTYLRRAVAPHNFLLWGAPGSGKTYLVQQIAAALGDAVQYREINLAQQDETVFRAALRSLESADVPVLCLIDEVDSKPKESWPYELLLPLLEPSSPRSHPAAFVLAGSGGRELAEMRERIRGRSKGVDLLSRIPAGNEFVVPPLGAGDRMIVSTIQLLVAAKAEGHPIREVEKLALFYIAVDPTFSSARQLRSLASHTAQRIPLGEDRIRYDNLFGPGTLENKEFWGESGEVRSGLAGAFVHLSTKLSDNPPSPIPQVRPSLEPPSKRVSSSHERRIAVLPFANMSPDPNDEYFADGLTEELITRLYEVRGLEVIARTSVMSYKKKEVNIIVIGRELNVGTLIEGSVRKAGNRIRITAQLINGENGAHLWASTYDRNLDDIFAIQTDIATKIADSTGAALGGTTDETPTVDTANIDAYAEFLRGNRLARSGSPEAWKEALRLFESALSKDPAFARAYVGLGMTQWMMANYGLTPFTEGVRAARESVGRALRLKEGLAEAHALLSKIAWADDEGNAAEREAKRALELNPNLPEAYGMLDQIAAIRGDPLESLRLARRAYSLDPVDSATVGGLGVSLLYAGKDEEFLTFWRKNRELNPFRAAVTEAEYFVGKGDLGKAADSLTEARRLRPSAPWTDMFEAYLAARRGERDRALKLVAQFENTFPDWPGLAGFALGALGDLDGFFRKVDEAFAKHSLHTDSLMYSPLCAAARLDPRYEPLVARIRRDGFRD